MHLLGGVFSVTWIIMGTPPSMGTPLHTTEWTHNSHTHTLPHSHPCTLSHITHWHTTITFILTHSHAHSSTHDHTLTCSDTQPITHTHSHTLTCTLTLTHILLQTHPPITIISTVLTVYETARHPLWSCYLRLTPYAFYRASSWDRERVRNPGKAMQQITEALEPAFSPPTTDPDSVPSIQLYLTSNHM